VELEQHADSNICFIIHYTTFYVTEALSDCQVVEESKVLFEYKPEQNPHFPQNFNRVITPEDV
jgi:hypothetical protein